LPGAKIVPGAFATVRVAAALPKGRSAAAQAALATLVKQAIDTGAVDRAFEAHGRLDGVVAQAFDAQGRLEGVMRARDEGPPPERLIIGSSDSNASLPSDGYDDEDVEQLVQKCVADAAQDTDGWSKKDIEEATRKQCAARKRHVEAYESARQLPHADGVAGARHPHQPCRRCRAAQSYGEGLYRSQVRRQHRRPQHHGRCH
jgi:hypothetical protein